jgi:hypothetical protein
MQERPSQEERRADVTRQRDTLSGLDQGLEIPSLEPQTPQEGGSRD